MVLFIIRNIVESCTVILLTIVLGAVVDNTTEATPDYTSTVLSNIVILIVSKVLYNIITTIKQFIIIEFTI